MLQDAKQLTMSREHGGQGRQKGAGSSNSRKEGVAEKELGKGKLLPRSLGNSLRRVLQKGTTGKGLRAQVLVRLREG